jgi:hypothetical protein
MQQRPGLWIQHRLRLWHRQGAQQLRWWIVAAVRHGKSQAEGLGLLPGRRPQQRQHLPAVQSRCCLRARLGWLARQAAVLQPLLEGLGGRELCCQAWVVAAALAGVA